MIVLKKFASMFNKETGKKPFLTFPAGSCKEEKAPSTTRKKTLQAQNTIILRKGA